MLLAFVATDVAGGVKMGKSKGIKKGKSNHSSFGKSHKKSGTSYKKLTKPAADPATPCLEVTVTGSKGGPQARLGLGGAGTLVTYGTIETGCRDLLLQFDMGRGTTLRLTEVGVEPRDMDAIFLTHIHNDHTDDLPIFMVDRWVYGRNNIDIVCGGEEEYGSCRAFLEAIGDIYKTTGLIPNRVAGNDALNPLGPAGLINATYAEPTELPNPVWSSGNVTVSSIRTQHISGSLAYRLDTPAGSVVIAGDTSNDEQNATLRDTSTSANVELLAEGADILVISTIHPVLSPELNELGNPTSYNRQSAAPDVAAMAERLGVQTLIPTHLVPAIGEEINGVDFTLTLSDWEDAVRNGGFTRQLVVATELATVRLP